MTGDQLQDIDLLLELLAHDEECHDVKEVASILGISPFKMGRVAGFLHTYGFIEVGVSGLKIAKCTAEFLREIQQAEREEAKARAETWRLRALGKQGEHAVKYLKVILKNNRNACAGEALWQLKNLCSAFSSPSSVVQPHSFLTKTTNLDAHASREVGKMASRKAHSEVQGALAKSVV